MAVATLLLCACPVKDGAPPAAGAGKGSTARSGGTSSKSKRPLSRRLVRFPGGYVDRSWLGEILKSHAGFVGLLKARIGLAELYKAKLDYFGRQPLIPTTLKPASSVDARVIRSRGLLVLAGYMRANYRLAVDLQSKLLSGRLALGKRARQGVLTSYYLARVLALAGQWKKADSLLRQSLKQVSPKYAPRVRAWLAFVSGRVGGTGSRDEKSGDPALRAAATAADPGGLRELSALAILGFVPKEQLPKTQADPGGSLMAAVARGDLATARARLLSSRFSRPVQSEVVTAGKIKGTIDYYDPLLLLATARHYEDRAIAALGSLTNGQIGLYHRTIVAQRRARWKEAEGLCRKLLAVGKRPLPFSFRVFQRWGSVPGLRLAVKARLAYALLRQGRRKAADRELDALSAAGQPGPALAGLYRILAGAGSAEALRAVDGGVIASRDLETRLLKRLATAKGIPARLARTLRMGLWLHRPARLWQTRALLALRKNASAARLLEQLHSKDTQFELSSRNWPDQMVMLATAYVGMSRLDVATIFYDHARKRYPILQQQWAVLRSLRVLLAMGSRGKVKGG